MSLLQQWKELAEKERNDFEYQKFWSTYFEKEKEIYEQILGDYKNIVNGSFIDLVEKFRIDKLWLVGFVEGINTSLVEEVVLENLEETSEIKFEIDYKKLYLNMLDAKADWLYALPQWEKVLPADERKEISKKFHDSRRAVRDKVGRNEDCPCGSGKKYKKCCGK